MTHENIDLVRRMDFDRIDTLVSERIAAFKLYAQSVCKHSADEAAHDAICGDLILPAVSLLLEFLDCVEIGSDE